MPPQLSSLGYGLMHDDDASLAEVLSRPCGRTATISLWTVMGRYRPEVTEDAFYLRAHDGPHQPSHDDRLYGV